MTSKPSITIRFGALHDTINVDGTEFTRHKLDRGSFTKLRRIVVGALEKIGYFGKSV